MLENTWMDALTAYKTPNHVTSATTIYANYQRRKTVCTNTQVKRDHTSTTSRSQKTESGAYAKPISCNQTSALALASPGPELSCPTGRSTRASSCPALLLESAKRDEGAASSLGIEVCLERKEG